jgi:hypothetical protein
MKALSVKQPWANMIASGRKTIETRRWGTTYRGPLAIASTKIPNVKPAGCVLAVATLTDCRPMRFSDEQRAHVGYERGLYAWILADIRRLDVPLPVRGYQGLYEVDLATGSSTPPVDMGFAP